MPSLPPYIARMPDPSKSKIAQTVRVSLLDSPDVAGHAWRRYRRLMRWMAAAAAVAAVVAITVLRLRNPDAAIHLYIAAAAGVFVSVLLGAALMGLVFLSAGTGHDEAVEDFLGEERERP